MKNYFNTFLWILFTIFQISLCEIRKVPIKSHKVMTKDITLNEVESIYDNNMSTVGSFYHSAMKNVQVEFDLGANYVIEKIVATIKSENSEINFIVGNQINGDGGLLYNCNNKRKVNVYECIPKCRADDPTRNGVVARKLLMSFLVKGAWASIYELQVFEKIKNLNSGDISQSKIVTPDDCNAKSWLLTNSMTKTKSIAHKSGTKIYLEKEYIIKEIDFEFSETVPKNLKIQLSNGNKKQVDLDIEMEKCSSVKSKYTCQIDKSTFATRIIILVSDGVSLMVVRGKPVFYPTLKVKTSNNMKENLKLTCKIEACDLSVHSDCSDRAMKAGVQFPCNNKQLIRMPSGSNLDSYVIVNQGQIIKDWANTNYSVESNEDTKMVVSMPRSYQYFGQYQCSCIVADQFNTDIKSSLTTLNEMDFLQNLIFNINAQYKLDEAINTFSPITDNLLLISDKMLKNTFIVMKVVASSLVKGITMNISYPFNEKEFDSQVVDTYSSEEIKAFNDNPQSWSVKIYKYQIDEIFPEFIHNKKVEITFTSSKYNLTQKSSIQFMKINDNTKTKPEWSQTITEKSISVKAVFTGESETNVTASIETCTKSENKIIAVLKNNICKVLDSTVTCSNKDKMPLLTINSERNMATKYKYSFVDTASKKTLDELKIDNSLNSDHSGIKTEIRYIGLRENPSSASINNVQFEIKFISKVVEDFIPCGKVTLKLMAPGHDIKQLVLQKPTYIFDLDFLSQSGINATFKLEIEGANKSYSINLTLENPLKFSIKKLELQGDSKLTLLWHGVDSIVYDLLVGYEVKVDTTIIPCNSTKVKTVMIKKSDIVGGKNRYETELEIINEKHSSNLVVTVQPVYLFNKRGPISQLKKLSDRTKKTRLLIDNVILTNQRAFTVQPSQSDIPCEITDIEFSLKGINVESPTTKIVKKNKLTYMITDLIPGRKYSLTAMTKYPFGPTDPISKIYQFETADEISITQSRHIAQVNDKVNITCIASVGPMGKYRKTIEWLRADRSPLPEGVVSETDENKPNMAFLIMNKALADFSNDYGCFVKPAAIVGAAEINVIINDLNVIPKSIKVNFEEVLKPIKVKCTSSSVGDGNLVWTDVDNEKISETENDNYKIVKVITKEKAIETTLLIKKPSLATSGTYSCLKAIGEFKAKETFTLYGKQGLKIELLPNSSLLIGEKSKLRCTGKPGIKNQKVIWETKSIVDNNKNLLKISSPENQNSIKQDLEIINNLAIHQVTCKLVPLIDGMTTELEESYKLKLDSKIIVEGPTQVKVGQSVNLTCIGHHTSPSTLITWVFFPKGLDNSTSIGEVISTMDSKEVKSYEPIKLVLNLKEVNKTQDGRYECKFKSDSRSPSSERKSISLSITGAKNSLINIPVLCLDCSKKSAYTIYFKSNFSKSFYILFVALSLLFRL